MERYKNYLIDAKALGENAHWEPRFTIYNADGAPVNPLKYRALHVHEGTEAAAIERALVSARKYIDDEL